MRRIILLLAILLIANSAWAEIKTGVEHLDNTTAATGFHFKNLPAPSKDDTAAKAKLSIVEGERDPNSGDVDRLIDGQLPTEADAPDDNFFFNEGSDGGRFLIDLGRPIQIKQINSYSWHPSTRGPQVYKLYASDGAAADFNAPPMGVDPEKAGWKLIATIDTRPRKADGSVVDNDDLMGGQYGVCISDSTGVIGTYRYLLFVTSRTEDHDDWGNTFYSEIDVIDAASSAPATQPAAKANSIEGQFVTIDVSAAPDLDSWARDRLLPVCGEWYPKIRQLLASDGFVAPAHFTVAFRGDLPKGVPAWTNGNRITCSIVWIRRNLQGEAVGAVVHEMAHVVQQYGSRRSNPGWLVEGIADYIRWFEYEPQTHGADIRNPQSARYDASYRVTANFLNYIAEHQDKQIIAQLNASLRQGTYNNELWKTCTGKSAAELAEEWKQSLSK